MSTATLPPGQCQVANSASPLPRLPHSTLFTERAHRCQTLAHSQPNAETLHFCGALAAQQNLELQQFPPLPLPDAELLRHCQKYEMPPLSPAGWPPHPHWQELVNRLIRAAAPELTTENRQALQRCPTTDPRWLDIQTSHLLRGNVQLISGIAIPFIGAALQVQWSALAARLKPERLQRVTPQSRCPLCGSLPVAASLNQENEETHRHLHCSLCSSSWQVENSKCSNCGSSSELGSSQTSEQLSHVTAEVCHHCKSYLKRIDRIQVTDAEPVADDLASEGLDTTMTAQSLSKIGVNLFLLPGSPQRG